LKNQDLCIILYIIIINVPMTPFLSMTYLPTLKGFKSTTFLPADYLLFCMRTLMVSIGWMAVDAMHPESDPTKKGFTYPQIEFYVIKSKIYINNMTIIINCDQYK